MSSRSCFCVILVASTAVAAVTAACGTDSLPISPSTQSTDGGRPDSNSEAGQGAEVSTNGSDAGNAEGGGSDGASDGGISDGGSSDADDGRVAAPDAGGPWVVSAGGVGSDLSKSVATLADGTSYIAGSFSGAATFGSGAHARTLTANGNTDGFVAKYDPLGVLLWVVPIGRASDDSANAVAVLADGTAYVTGSASGPGDGSSAQVTFGSTSASAKTAPVTGSGGMFLARYDAAGVPSWGVVASGTAGSFAGLGSSVALKSNGTACVTGTFYATTSFASTAGGSTSLSAQGTSNYSDGFVAQYSANGALNWAVDFGEGSDDDEGTSVAVLDDGSAFLTGWYGPSTVTFGTTSGASQMLPFTGHYFDSFLAKYDNAGVISWAVTVGGLTTLAAYTYVKSVVADPNGVHVAGFSNGNPPVVTTFGSTSGASKTLAAFGFVATYSLAGVPSVLTGMDGAPTAVALGPSGTLGVVGAFSGTSTFGGQTLTVVSAAGSDAFLVKIDPLGVIRSALGMGGPQADQASSVSILGDGTTYVTGSFQGTATFGGPTATSAGGDDAFLARLPP